MWNLMGGGRPTKVRQETGHGEDRAKLLQVGLNELGVEVSWVKFAEGCTGKRKGDGNQLHPSWFLRISCSVH